MWLLPTYNRPEKFANFLAAAKATGTSTPGVVIVNGDRAGYDFSDLPQGWTVIDVPPEGMVKAVNTALAMFPSEPWYGMLVDDSVPDHVVHAVQRDLEPDRQGLGRSGADRQRADQARPGGHRDRVQVPELDLGALQRGPHHRDHLLQVRP